MAKFETGFAEDGWYIGLFKLDDDDPLRLFAVAIKDSEQALQKVADIVTRSHDVVVRIIRRANKQGFEILKVADGECREFT